MTKTIILNTENMAVASVFNNVPADYPYPAEYLAIKEADDLRPLSNAKLVTLYNMQNSDQVNKFADKATAVKRVFKSLSALEVQDTDAKPETDAKPVKRSKKQRILGQEVQLLGGWEEKRFNKGSQRAQCFEVLRGLTDNGKKPVEVEDYIEAAVKDTGFTKAQVIACLNKLIITVHQPTVEVVKYDI